MRFVSVSGVPRLVSSSENMTHGFLGYVQTVKFIAWNKSTSTFWYSSEIKTKTREFFKMGVETTPLGFGKKTHTQTEQR